MNGTNQWRYGLTPYREIMFEYPPAVIPLIALPLELDQRGIGKYYLNYRVQTFAFEILLFTAMVFCTLHIQKEANPKHRGLKDWRSWIPYIFYIGAGVLAKDYWYEGIDLIFFGSFTLGLMFVLAKQQTFLKRVFLWTLFWLSVAIKIMTAPLAFPIYLTKTLPWKKNYSLWAECSCGSTDSVISIFTFGLCSIPREQTMKYSALERILLRRLTNTHTLNID